MNTICQSCGKKIYSLYDKTFLEQHGKCWECAKLDWLKNKITLEEFEKQEMHTLNSIT